MRELDIVEKNIKRKKATLYDITDTLKTLNKTKVDMWWDSIFSNSMTIKEAIAHYTLKSEVLREEVQALEARQRKIDHTR